jgi:hypothetical protein
MRVLAAILWVTGCGARQPIISSVVPRDSVAIVTRATSEFLKTPPASPATGRARVLSYVPRPRGVLVTLVAILEPGYYSEDGDIVYCVADDGTTSFAGMGLGPAVDFPKACLDVNGAP